jgi:serine protease AprX
MTDFADGPAIARVARTRTRTAPNRRRGVVALVALALVAIGTLGTTAAAAASSAAKVQLHSSGWKPSSKSFSGTLSSIGASDLFKHGYTGAGIDVAVIDSGVSPVTGLAGDGKVINGPDLSFDLQGGAQPYLDSYGHGTHLAGIIAGRDPGVSDGDDPSSTEFVGVAPDARIVNVKVAGASGETDVTQVIAAIDWVVQHRNSDGLNIRVINLAYGTDSGQDYRSDPLAYAAEVAWRNGIVVVAAAGNSGAERGRLDNPAYDPFVIAVGADDTGSSSWTGDDKVPAWSSLGDGVRNPDLLAPGVAVRSLRAPGSLLDRTVPESAAGPRWIGGSGTSQAAAVVSGAAALILQNRPRMTPDQVKAVLVATANHLPSTDQAAQGAGLIDVEGALDASVRSNIQSADPSTGTGSLEAARGSSHVAINGTVLEGEQDIFGVPWDPATWSARSAAGQAWDGGIWNGNQWAGACFCETALSGLSWSGLSWSGLSWSGLSWSGLSWSGLSWSGLSWSTAAWGDG